MIRIHGKQMPSLHHYCAFQLGFYNSHNQLGKCSFGLQETLIVSSYLKLSNTLFIDPGSGPDLQVLFRTGHSISQSRLE